MSKNKVIRKINNSNIENFLQIFLSIILLMSIIQVLPIPEEMKLVNEVQSSSIISQSNWSAPENYTETYLLDFLPLSGDLALKYGQWIYVLDSYNNRIVRTMMDGTGWRAYGAGQFGTPMGFNYDIETGFFYIADTYKSRIVKTKLGGAGWTTYGGYGSGTGKFSLPYDLFYEPSTGFIYVADTYNHRIVKTKMDGTGWTTYGTFGHGGQGEFQYPMGISYDSFTDHVYLTHNNFIVKTKMDGTNWTTYGGSGSGNDQFMSPNQIWFDNDTGYLYIADSNCRIVKTMMNGSGWSTYGSPGNGKGQFQAPRGLYFDKATDLMYVADFSNNRIVRTRMNGSGWATLYSEKVGNGRFGNPGDVAKGEKGYCLDGYMVSKEFQLGGFAEILSINWVGDIPNGTSIKLQIKSALDRNGLKAAAFVGPVGSTDKFYNISGAKVWAGHRGDKWMQYKVILETTDGLITPVLKDVNIEYNLLPHKPVIISPEDNYKTNDNKTVFNWLHMDSDSNSQNGFEWQIDDDRDFNNIDHTYNQTGTIQTSYWPDSPIADGIWYWRLKTQDSDGGWGNYSNPRKILIDTAKPISEIIEPRDNKFYKRLYLINGSAIDINISSGVNRTEILIKRIFDGKTWDGSNWKVGEHWQHTTGLGAWLYNSSTVTWTSGNSYSLQTRAYDNVTNLESPSEGIIIYYDHEAPVSTIEVPGNLSAHNKLAEISGSSYDIGGSGLSKVEISILEVSTNKYWSGKNWVDHHDQQTWLAATGTDKWSFDSRWVLWNPGEEYIIESKATDNLDIPEVPKNNIQIEIDIDRPRSIVEFPAVNSYLNDVPVIFGSSTDLNGSGVSSVEINLKRTGDSKYWTGQAWSSATQPQWLMVEGTDNWTFDSSEVEWSTDQYYEITSRVTDRAGNYRVSEPGNIFMFDNKKPSLEFSLADGNKYTNMTLVKLSIEAFDTGSGVTKMALSQNDHENQWSDWLNFKDEYYYNLTPGDGEKNLYMQVLDRAGNIGDIIIGTIILDTTEPQTFITINDNDKFTNTKSINFTLSAIDTLSGILDMSFSRDQVQWSPWEQFNQEKSYSLFGSDGEKTVYVRVRDAAGNCGIANDTIILDTTPPRNLEIIINDGAESTKYINVTLKLSAIDTGSGPYKMTFCDLNSNWSEWESFSENRIYILPLGNGEKHVFFKVMDKAGNVGSPVSARIDLTESGNGKQDTEHDSPTQLLDLWLVLALVIIVIVIIVIIMVWIHRKKDTTPTITIKPRDAQETLVAGASADRVMVQPIQTMDQLAPAIKTQTQNGTPGVELQQEQIQPSTAIRQLEQAQAQQRPALPPPQVQADLNDLKIENNKDLPVAEVDMKGE